MEKEKFVEIMKEAGKYTNEEIERLWKTAPLHINEDKLREKAEEYAKIEIHNARVSEELNHQLTKIQREKLEKM